MKRIAICCDGTWNMATEESKVTNIVRLRRVITPTAKDGTVQEIYYDSGIGTEGGTNTISGGIYGEGMDKNVLDAYAFLVDNYEDGDELYFFGFSRGAYTVRSLIGLLNNAGLLKNEHKDKLSETYKLYRSDDPLDSPHGERAIAFRRQYSREVPVHFLGVFDTVGALGIPLTMLDSYNAKKYGFHDTTLSGIVKNAYHALAIDEKNYEFFPTLWQAKESTKSEQRWFAGVHSDIGGGYKDSHGLSDITLKWMLSKAHECGLDYNLDNYRGFNPDPTATLHDKSSVLSMLGEHARHVCDTSVLKEKSVHIPHEFNSMYSWFRKMKDKAAPSASIPWWDLVGKAQSLFDSKSICELQDVKLDDSVITRMDKLPNYRPSNIMPLIVDALTIGKSGVEVLRSKALFANRPNAHLDVVRPAKTRAPELQNNNFLLAAMCHPVTKIMATVMMVAGLAALIAGSLGVAGVIAALSSAVAIGMMIVGGAGATMGGGLLTAGFFNPKNKQANKERNEDTFHHGAPLLI